jgi:hypothetical protein
MEIDSFQSHKLFENRFRNIYYFHFSAAYAVIDARGSFADEIYVATPKNIGLLTRHIRAINSKNARKVTCQQANVAFVFYVFISTNVGNFVLETIDQRAADELAAWIYKYYEESSEITEELDNMSLNRN